jgi:nicotinamide mononucleotide transporter
MSAAAAQLLAELRAAAWFEWLAVVAGIAYVVLIARQRRSGWIAGGISSVLYVYVSWQAQLPLQSGLQAFYVLMAVHGWYSWTRAAGAAAPPIASHSLRWHLLALAVIVLIALLAAQPLAVESNSAWPRLDSLTTVTSVLATWLVIRCILENWLYWIAVDAVSACMFYLQGHALTAVLFTTYFVVAVVGYITWRQRYQAQRP